ncbi:MAG: PQQ-like beta-propeller repeat protein [Spirochaetales bacterium]|nr:PQQ-like beta-propeller repeat protein [Spirochaetales bacterium]
MKRTIFYGLLFILILILTGCAQVFMQDAEKMLPAQDKEAIAAWDAWQMFRHDARHSGYVEARAPTTPTLFWKVNVGLPIYSSPAIGSNRYIYVGAKDVLLAINERNGRPVWKAPMVGEVYSSPATDPYAGKQGLVYCASYGSRSSTLSAFDMQTGDRVWWTWMTTKSSPTLAYNITNSDPADIAYPVVPRCTLFIGSQETLLAINADKGKTVWSFDAYGVIDSTPAVDERNVYFGTNNNIIYAVNRYTGRGIWKFEAKGPVKSSPAVGEKFLIAASLDGIIYCLYKETGELYWVLQTKGKIVSSPAYYRGFIYIGSGMELLKLNEYGRIVWTARTLGDTISSPALSAGKVYIGSSKTESASIFCFDDKSGRPVWSKWMDVVSSPSLMVWSLIVPSLDGNIYCFNDLE